MLLVTCLNNKQLSCNSVLMIHYFQKAQKYTLQIEARDDGDKVQLSSTSTVVLNIIDHNNHLPEITGHTVSTKLFIPLSKLTYQFAHTRLDWSLNILIYQMKKQKCNALFKLIN